MFILFMYLIRSLNGYFETGCHGTERAWISDAIALDVEEVRD